MPPSTSTRKGHLPLEETLSDWHPPAWVGDPRIPVVYGGEYVKIGRVSLLEAERLVEYAAQIVKFCEGLLSTLDP
jgi:hypothetical protein